MKVNVRYLDDSIEVTGYGEEGDVVVVASGSLRTRREGGVSIVNDCMNLAKVALDARSAVRAHHRSLRASFDETGD